jgi:hypothetical protein
VKTPKKGRKRGGKEGGSGNGEVGMGPSTSSDEAKAEVGKRSAEKRVRVGGSLYALQATQDRWGGIEGGGGTRRRLRGGAMARQDAASGP